MKITFRKITFFLVLLLTGVLIYKSLIANGVISIQDVYTNVKALENTNSLLQIISCIFVITGVFIAVWQYVLSTRSEMAKYHNERIQKAIDLSEYYKDEILCNMIILYNVYKKTKILDILETIKISDMKHFNSKELERNLSSSQLNDLTKLLSSAKLIEVLIEVNEIYCFMKKPDSSFRIVREGKDDEEVHIDVTKVYDEFVNGIVSRTLNNLEFFAMHFTHDTADESVVYQSLHSTYLEVIQMLYYNIAKNNSNADKMIYTNVIELFNLWKQQAIVQSVAEQKNTEQNIIKGRLAKPLKIN